MDMLGKTVSVFGFEITIYGIFIAVGMLAGLSFIILQAKRQNQDQNLYLEALIPGVVFGAVSARVCYIALHWKIFAKEPQRALWDIRTGGMVMYGALLGGIAALAVFCKIRKLSFGRMADTIIPGVVISQMIGVWGNFFSREYTGRYTDSILAMQLPAETLSGARLTAEMQENIVKIGDISYVQVHPLFIYESLWCFFLLCVLFIISETEEISGRDLYEISCRIRVGKSRN